MYKLIALDMDGTLLSPDGTISARTQRAIRDAKAQGVYVVLATGRPLEGVQRYLAELDMETDNDFVLCYNGGLVQNVKTQKIINSELLSGIDAKNLESLANDLHVHVHAFSPTRGLITPENSHYTQHEADINEIAVVECNFNKLTNDEAILKVMMIDEPEVLSQAIAQLPEFLYDKYTVVQSTPFFLEFLNKECNKGVGIAALANYLDIKQEEVICMGDAGNDYHMVEYAGLGVAMANASQDLKAIANVITHSNADDGVAHIIEEYVLKSSIKAI